MSSTTATPAATESNADVAARIAGDVAATLVGKPKRNGVQAVSDKPATRKPKAKAAPKPSRVPVSINGVTVMVDSKLTKANQLKFARQAVNAMTDRQKAKARKGATATTETERAAKPARAKRTPRTAGPLGAYEAKYASKPNWTGRVLAFEKAVIAADADFVAMFAKASAAATPKERARIAVAMYAAFRTCYRA